MATYENVSFEKIKRRKRKSTGDLVFSIVNSAVLILFSLIALYPILNMVALSFNDGIDAFRGHIHIIPRAFTLENYQKILDRYSIQQGMIVTVARTVIGTALSLIANAMLAFILSRKNFMFKKSLSLFWIFTLYASAGFVPTIVLYRYLHLTSNFWVYIVPNLVGVMNVIVMRTYMKTIPDSLEEAAQMEGAGYLTVFWKIICPLCKPVLAATALFTAAFHWNSWFDALVFNRMRLEYTTLQYEIMKYLTQVMVIRTGGVVENTSIASPILGTGATPQSLRCALVVISMLPILIIFPFFQKHFVSGLKVGGVKE